MEILVIGLTRLLGSMVVLRWAFAGALVAILVDLSDLFQMALLDLGGVPNYQRLDKAADLAYMITFLVVSRRWTGIARSWSAAFFVWRICGLVAFEVTEIRLLLVVFANVFEFWFVANAAILHWRPERVLDRRLAVLVLFAVVPLKLAQEYVLHYGRWLDSFTAAEAVSTVWGWVSAW